MKTALRDIGISLAMALDVALPWASIAVPETPRTFAILTGVVGGVLLALTVPHYVAGIIRDAKGLAR